MNSEYQDKEHGIAEYQRTFGMLSGPAWRELKEKSAAEIWLAVLRQQLVFVAVANERRDNMGLLGFYTKELMRLNADIKVLSMVVETGCPLEWALAATGP